MVRLAAFALTLLVGLAAFMSNPLVPFSSIGTVETSLETPACKLAKGAGVSAVAEAVRRLAFILNTWFVLEASLTPEAREWI